MRKHLLLILALLAAPASAQILPFLSKYPSGQRSPPPGQPVQNPIEVMRADFAAQSGGTTVYFTPGKAQLTLQARTILAAQAVWLRQHPEIPVRIEGHGDTTD